jgi:hypothetical protein
MGALSTTLLIVFSSDDQSSNLAVWSLVEQPSCSAQLRQAHRLLYFTVILMPSRKTTIVLFTSGGRGVRSAKHPAGWHIAAVEPITQHNCVPRALKNAWLVVCVPKGSIVC